MKSIWVEKYVQEGFLGHFKARLQGTLGPPIL